MRGLRCVLAVVGVVGLGGCHGGADMPEKTQQNAAAGAATKACTVQFGGHDVLKLAAPADAQCLASEGELNVMARDGYVHFWLVTGTKTVDEAARRADKIIVSEFKNLKVTGTTDLTVAGAPAKRLAGTGQEADDNDPGTADAVAFTVGGRVFVACTHGESMRASAQQLMIKMVQTAKAP